MLVILRWVKNVVFCNEMTRAWVQGSSQKRGQKEIEVSVCREFGDDNVVKDNLNDNVEKMDQSEFDLGDEHWSKGVEEDLESGKERFTQDVRQDQSLKTGWNIGVEFFITEEFVMQLMVWLERCTVWDSDGEIDKYGKESVEKRFPKQ